MGARRHRYRRRRLYTVRESLSNAHASTDRLKHYGLELFTKSTPSWVRMSGWTSLRGLLTTIHTVTLVILFALSGAIVIRSYLLRRRHRRLMEEAIRNGTYIAPTQSKRKPGERPILHDAFMSYQSAEDMPQKSYEEQGSWEEVMVR